MNHHNQFPMAEQDPELAERQQLIEGMETTLGQLYDSKGAQRQREATSLDGVMVQDTECNYFVTRTEELHEDGVRGQYKVEGLFVAPNGELQVSVRELFLHAENGTVEVIQHRPGVDSKTGSLTALSDLIQGRDVINQFNVLSPKKAVRLAMQEQQQRKHVKVYNDRTRSNAA